MKLVHGCGQTYSTSPQFIFVTGFTWTFFTTLYGQFIWVYTAFCLLLSPYLNFVCRNKYLHFTCTYLCFSHQSYSHLEYYILSRLYKHTCFPERLPIIPRDCTLDYAWARKFVNGKAPLNAVQAFNTGPIRAPKGPLRAAFKEPLWYHNGIVYYSFIDSVTQASQGCPYRTCTDTMCKV